MTAGVKHQLIFAVGNPFIQGHCINCSLKSVTHFSTLTTFLVRKHKLVSCSLLPTLQHFYNSFGHLNGYSSNYYIYQWSRAISTDLFSRFKTQGLRDRQTADTYRRKVLAPGGSKPAAEAVADFLGRPFSTDAYRDYLGQLRQQ